MNKNILVKFLYSGLFLCTGFITNAQVLIGPGVNNGDFETGPPFSSWTVVNAPTNAWNCGVTGAQAGANGAYISNAPPAATYNTNIFQISHFYRDFSQPVGTATLSFNWRTVGENGFDYLEVFLVPATQPVTANVQLPLANRISGPLLGQAGWQSVTITLPCNPTVVMKRLVFSWRNDNSLGTNPPGQIDNVLLNNNPAVSAPANDLPCNASVLPFGIYIPGNNECATNTSEPAPPGCFVNGASQVHSVWYRFQATSTCYKIKTSLGTLTNSQIGVYSGACGALALIAGGNCNNDFQPCAGAFTYNHSQLSITTTVGTWYYIMVDGVNALQGTFSIQLIDGGPPGCTNNFPPIPVQDCVQPAIVCSYTTLVPNPGYQAVGNVCDFGVPVPCTGGTAGCGGPGANPTCTTNCLCSAERASSWYQITCNGTGTLEFSIVPNDWPGPPSTFSTDYDFAIWQVSTGGTPGPSSCSNLTSPIRCHWSPLGVTGCYGAVSGISPPAYPGFGAAYRAGIPVNSGDVFLLNVSNFTNSTSGFTLEINPASPIAATIAPGGTVVWTGTVSTDWHNINNWGGCQIPTCQVNAVIPSFPINQPVISVADASCRSMDINLGASVTLNAARQLMICNDYTNNGVFTASAGSTVLFTDTCLACPGGISHNQNMYGSMTGANRFWNVTVSKNNLANRTVKTWQDVDMAGNFFVTGGAVYNSIFDAAGMYHRVGGNFTADVTGPSIGTYVSSATLEFNGTVQNYLNRGTLNNVVMNQTGAGTLTLQDHLAASAWMNIGGAGSLTLTYGRIIAGTVANNRVEVVNRAFTAVSPGNVNSYVEGPGTGAYVLRKFMNNSGGTGVADFPVGTAARGYERISFNITTALPGTITYWQAGFQSNTPPFATPPLNGPECAVTYHTGGYQSLNHGWWQIQSSPSTLASGIMDVTNYNRSYTNPLIGMAWTVMHSKSSNTSGGWQLNPYPAAPCLASPITAVQRSNTSVSALFNSALPVWFATAQSQTPLPVELLSFEARDYKNKILLNWTTGSEKNNKGFELERTTTPPNNFEKIGWLDGHGTTSELNNYRYDDFSVNPNITYYYRLKQVDMNGDHYYSSIVAAKISREDFTFTVLPNPYSGSTNISYYLKDKTNVTIEVLSVMGQKIAVLFNGEQPEGRYNYEFSARKMGYAAGIYTVRVLVNDDVYTKRLLETE